MSRQTATESLSFDDVRWTTCSLSEFRDLYWDRIAPAFEADGGDPEHERPPHQWFRDRGARAFLAALRRHHDRSFEEFWREDLELGGDDGYDWATEDGATVDALEHFLRRRRDRYDLSESSLEALRTRLNRYVRAYARANDTDDLLGPVARDGDHPQYEAVDACYAAFDRLNDADYSARTLQRTRSAVDAWYEHLLGRRLAGFNPAAGLYEEFKWSVEDGDTPALSVDHVRALAAATADPRERLLVVALAAWGLRTSEVARLHVSQMKRDVPDEQVPYLAFEDRKNGPGQVSVLYGLDAFDARVDELLAGDDEEEWTGYLFPSAQGERPYVGPDTIRRWFAHLAGRADLPERIDGQRPSPQLCRRFWYDRYTAVLESVLEGVDEIAAEQGSTDPQVVMENYLSNARARQVRRAFMREQLTEAFEADYSQS